MKRLLQIVFFTFSSLCVLSVRAQKEKKAPVEADNKGASAKAKVINTYLGSSKLKGGTVPKHIFDSLLKQGIRSRDESGQNYGIVSFRFSYGERNLYEDSIGNLKIMVDYLSEPCFGDTVTTTVSNSLYERTKKGDTAYFDNVIVIRPDNTTTLSKSIKFAIGE
jgi:hypothetical protein